MPFGGPLETNRKFEIAGGGGTLTGADNGLSLDATGKIVELGGPITAFAPLLDSRFIELNSNQISFIDSPTTGSLTIQQGLLQGLYDQDSDIQSYIAKNQSAGNFAAIDSVLINDTGEELRMGVNSSTNFNGPRFTWIAGNSSAGLIIQSSVFGLNNPSPILFCVGGNTIGAPGGEKARFAADGSFLINRTVSINPAFVFQVKGVPGGFCSSFEAEGVAGISMRSGLGGNGAHYIGVPTGSGSPDLVFSNNALTETGRILSAGGFSAPSAGYGFHGNSGSALGMFDNGTGDLALASAQAQNMHFGYNGTLNGYGTFVFADSSLRLAGPISSSGLGNLWALGDIVAGAVVVDTTRSVAVTINGVAYKFIVAV